MTATTPWDSNLILTGIWGYPDDAVLGYTIFKIPVEEVFFFFVQTYTTTMVYLMTNKPIVHVSYLNEISDGVPTKRRVRRQRTVGLLVASGLVWTIAKAVAMARAGGPGKYMGLILGWSVPVLLFLW